LQQGFVPWRENGGVVVTKRRKPELCSCISRKPCGSSYLLFPPWAMGMDVPILPRLLEICKKKQAGHFCGAIQLEAAQINHVLLLISS